MEAKDVGVANQIHIKGGVCEGCVLADGHDVSPDYIQVSSDHGKDVETTLIISSMNGELRTTEVAVPGILRVSGIEAQLNTKNNSEDTLACNALCAFIESRRK